MRRRGAPDEARRPAVSAGALADLILVAHFAFVAFVVGGFALIIAGTRRGWLWVRRPGFRWLHLAAIVLVALEAVTGLACPLTVWEDALRSSDASPGGFIARWLAPILYWQLPGWVFTCAYAAFAAAVAYAMWRHPPHAGGSRKPLSCPASQKDSG